MKVIIMSGGKGKRFWPRSVDTLPKQFLALTSEQTMLQITYMRFVQFLSKDDIYIITNGSYVDIVKSQLPELGSDHLIIEPEQMDTGPCAAYAAAFLLERGIEDVMIMTPSDQYIPDSASLMQALRAAELTAQQDGSIVTLGIVPTRPETGYGYIETVPPVDQDAARKVKRFIEKPVLGRAEYLIRRPDVFWNSGILIWKPATVALYMQKFQPQIWQTVHPAKDCTYEAYAALPKISVDYAILEKAETIYMIPFPYTWDDVGSWTSLERVFEPDASGNIFHGDIVSSNTKNSIIHVENQKVILIGIEDLIIVSTVNGLLVCHKSKEQQIKAMINLMEKENNL